jgi:7-keto-8-aminopelargonate synthetase-like enzyme/acyl-CoA synthetase (AMP-forming)/AMP-acid ligase II
MNGWLPLKQCRTSSATAPKCYDLAFPLSDRIRLAVPRHFSKKIVRDTLLTILRRAAERRGREPIYRFLLSGDADGPQQTLSAEELEHDARKIGGALRALGHKADPNPRVLIACQSPTEFARAFFGILYAGALPVPTDLPLPRTGGGGLQALRSIVADARPRLLIGDAQAIDSIRKMAPGFDAEDSGCAMSTVQELMATADEQYCCDASPDGLAFLQYTSGSTASPRGVMITHANVLSNLRAIEKALAPPPDAVGVNWLPWSHDLGLVGNFLFALYAGSGQLVLLTPSAFALRPVRWLQAISRFRAWGTAAPNFAFALCSRVIKKAQLEGLDLSSLESVLCGAEPIDAATLARFSRRFEPCGFQAAHLRPCYGLAEATLFVSAAPSCLTAKTFDSATLAGGRLQESSPEAGRSLVSCGVVQDELQVAIVNPTTGQQMSEGEIGEIWISGASVGDGYFGWREEQNERVFRAVLPGEDRKYLRTGDLGAFYHDELYVTGRQKDVVVIHGKNYDANDLECTAVAAHPKLRAGNVAAFSDFEQGESVIVLAETQSSQVEHEYRAIARRIRARLAGDLGVQPSKVVIAPYKSIALTPTGKVRRGETRCLYQAGSITPLFTDTLAAPEENGWLGTSHNGSNTGLFEQILLREIRIAARFGEQEPLAGDVRLSELGIDSLGMAQLATALAEFIDKDTALALTNDDPTLATLIGRVRQAGRAEELRVQRMPAESTAQDVFEPAHCFKIPDQMRAADLMPFYQPFTNWEGTHAWLDGRRILILSSFDYLGLFNHPRVRQAAARAAHEHGTGRSSSRVHSATTPEILAMEEKLARFLGREDALVCTTGYQAMAGLVTSFMNSRTTLVVDEQIHASILDGAAIAHCRVKRFGHQDLGELEEILSQTRSAMVMVEGLYSNSGDIAPLPEIREICSRHGARLALDDAHALGVLGTTGRGTEEHFHCMGVCDVIAGTFSKTLVSVGGWIAGKREIIEYIRYHGRPVLFSAGISPPMLAAASASLDLLIEQPELITRLRHNAQCFLSELKRCSVPVTGQSGPIVRLPVGDDEVCVRLSRELLRRGIYVHTVVYPSVPRDAAMLRFVVSAGHDPADLTRAAQEIADCLNMFGSEAGSSAAACSLAAVIQL